MVPISYEPCFCHIGHKRKSDISLLKIIGGSCGLARVYIALYIVFKLIP